MRPRTCAPLVLLMTMALVAAMAGQTGAQPAGRRALLNRAVDLFESGAIADSVEAFDALVRIAPADAPYLWQRGIVLYYAGRYQACRAQFEDHRLVNPDDVENAAWHYLCVAKAESTAAARAALLPVGPDRRVPMREVYQMFRGSIGPDQVLAAAGPSLDGQFYANLYAGLFAEAQGDASRAMRHLKVAAEPRFADVGGYMHMVAVVHTRLKENATP